MKFTTATLISIAVALPFKDIPESAVIGAAAGSASGALIGLVNGAKTRGLKGALVGGSAVAVIGTGVGLPAGAAMGVVPKPILDDHQMN